MSTSSALSSNGSHIQDGTAQGMFEFLDYLIAKGYMPASSVSPWRSATSQVLRTVEKSDEIGGVAVRGLDLDDYLGRFETLARGNLKEESIQTYRRRFSLAHEAYIDFISVGKVPQARASSPRRPKAETPKAAPAAAASPEPAAVSPAERMIEYPFPLRNGQVGRLSLPMRLEKEDADRLSAFVRTLVFDQPKQITAGPADDDEPDIG